MKSVFKFSILLFLAGWLSSCEKEETRAVLTPAGQNQLTASPTTIILIQANASSPGVTFTWGETKYGYPAAVNYTLELSKGGTNFATATTTSINMGNLLSKSFTVGD